MIDIRYNKIILYGHKRNIHPFFDIAFGIYRALKYINFDVYWVDHEDERKISEIDLENSIFITEGTDDYNIPILSSCFYVLCHCNKEKYISLSKDSYLILNIINSSIINKQNLSSLRYNKYTYYSIKDNLLYMPTATPLFPTEITKNQREVVEGKYNKKNQVCYVGSINEKITDLNNIERQCKKKGILFKRTLKYKFDERIKLIKESKYPLSISSDNENNISFISSNIFEQISVCGYTITNSHIINVLLEDNVCFCESIDTMMDDAKNYIDNLQLLTKIELMEKIKKEHTYVSRIKCMLSIIKQIYIHNK